MNVHGYLAAKNRAEIGGACAPRAFPALMAGSNSGSPFLERRVIECQVELRAAKRGNGPGQLVGYAAKYNSLSQDLGGFFERLAPGCFADVMGGDTCCLRNHDDDNLLGRTAAGTLELGSDDAGLLYYCELPNTSVGRDTAELVGRGDMRGSSFQFSIAMEGASWDWDGPSPLRTITKVGRLYDVAPVTNPAYLDTTVDMRSFQAALEARDAKRAEAALHSLSLARARLRFAEAPLLL
jgi:uncharacterized protein